MSKFSQKGISLYLSIVIMVILLSIVLGISGILLGQLKMMKGMENFRQVDIRTVSLYQKANQQVSIPEQPTLLLSILQVILRYPMIFTRNSRVYLTLFGSLRGNNRKGHTIFMRTVPSICLLIRAPLLVQVPNLPFSLRIQAKQAGLAQNLKKKEKGKVGNLN